MSALSGINHDIWLPFSRCFAEGDVAGYLAFHAPEFVWVRSEAATILGYADYAQGMKDSFEDRAARGITVTIDFRFTERIVTADLASERGVYRMSGPGPDIFGRFHTFSRRTADGWRLIADYESAEAGPDDFAAASPLDV